MGCNLLAFAPTVSPSPRETQYMATIVRRPGKNGQQVYRVQVKHKGAPPLSATFTKLSDARKWVQVTEAAILEDRYFPTTEAKRHTLADLIDRYCRDILPSKAPESHRKQRQQLCWWHGQLGRCLLAEITPGCIAEHRDKLAQEHRAASTVNRYLSVLSHAFFIAVREWGWLDDSPMRNVTKPREPRVRVRYLSDQERHQLLKVCQTSVEPPTCTPSWSWGSLRALGGVNCSRCAGRMWTSSAVR